MDPRNPHQVVMVGN